MVDVNHVVGLPYGTLEMIVVYVFLGTAVVVILLSLGKLFAVIENFFDSL